VFQGKYLHDFTYQVIIYKGILHRGSEVEGCIVGFGNVLLDIICPISGDFLCKYELEPDTTTLAKEKHFPLFDEVKRASGVKYCSGGSASNTLRVAQWILGSYKGTALVGSVGNDEESVKLLDLLEANKVTLLCQKFPNAKTGRCAVLTQGVSRTLVTQLGASVLFDYTEFIHSSFDYVMTNSRVIYISVYSTTNFKSYIT
jgi:adenosine kinase